MSKKGCVILLTGLPCAGKSTIAENVYEYLLFNRKQCIHFDGDSFREMYHPELGFSQEDRIENITRLGLKAMSCEMDGSIVLCSFIAPYANVREDLRGMCTNFIEVHVHADRQTCIDRDVKGMWEKAINGEIKNFTGHTSEYEEPTNPEIICLTAEETIEESTQKIIEYLKDHEIIN